MNKLAGSLLVLIFAILGIQKGHSQSDFYFNNEAVKPGNVKHFSIPISDGAHKTIIPISVFNGVKDGPVLGITAGVHGYEYPPIMAAQKLINKINPDKLKGTVILVQVANVASFLGRSPFTNPLDDKNLNRSFPGDENGSVTERMAHFISEGVINKADYFLDMHAGDAPEDLATYTAYYSHDDKEKISRIGNEMANALGFDYKVVFNTTEKSYVKAENPSLYCSAEAFKRGIPAADIECGKLGMSPSNDVDQITKGVLNLLDYLKMQEVDDASRTINEAVTIKERSYISSNHNGIFHPSKKSGVYVTKGMKLGYITDFFGKKIQDIHADSNGILLLIIGTPPINKGETVAVIGKVD